MREMKNSGVEWIGEIPQDWGLVQFKYLILDSISGEVIDKTYWNDGCELLYTCQRTPMYSTFDKFPPNKRTAENDLLLTRNATPYVFLPVVNSIYSNVVQKVTIKAPWDKRYVRYALQLGVEEQRVNGDTIPSYNMDVWKNIYICKIPLNLQIRIADFLDGKCAEIDRLVADIQDQIEVLEQNKKSVIIEAVTKGLNPDVPKKDSGIEWVGKVNKNYCIKKLKYGCIILDEFRQPVTAHLRSHDSEVLYDYYGASGAIDKIDGYTIDSDVLLIGEDGANLRMRNLPLIYQVHGKAWINNHAHIVKPIDGVLDYTYAFFMLESLDINPYITGSAQPKFNQESLQNMHIIVPPFNEQQHISNYLNNKCSEIDDVISEKKEQVEVLREYKKSLIYEYVTGKKELK